MASPVQFSRTPYTVTYYKDGEKHTIRRQPPPKLHNVWPEDVVKLTTKKSDDFDAGENYKVKGINPRHPNVIQIEDSDGNSTFVPHYDVELKEAIGQRDGVEPKDLPINNRYLLWP
ncbi:MAG: hypothetical protein AB7T49_06595 [Oligoflexales bacterium]